jgi:TRAP-type C4-dicarboxylate transport system permease small subunit
MHPVFSVLICLLLLLLGGFLAYHAVVALRVGAANAAGIVHKRSEKPFMFWLTVAIQLGFALICLYQLLLSIGRLPATGRF